jgi:hydrogenase nickel insertion protein HypA
MHEFSLAQRIVEIVAETASSHDLRHVTEVRLDVGTASGVSTDALEFAWEFLRTTTALTDHADLAIRSIQAAGKCPNCGFNGDLNDAVPLCPACGAGGFRLACGAEFTVAGISGE